MMSVFSQCNYTLLCFLFLSCLMSHLDRIQSRKVSFDPARSTLRPARYTLGPARRTPRYRAADTPNSRIVLPPKLSYQVSLTQHRTIREVPPVAA